MKLPNGTYATTPRGDERPRPTALAYYLARTDDPTTIVDPEPFETLDDAFGFGEVRPDAELLSVVAELDDGTTRVVGPVDPFQGLS